MRMPCQSCNGTLIAARSHKQENSAKFQSHLGSLAVRNASRAWSEKGIWGDWFDIFEVVIATSGSAATATTTTTIVGSSLHNGVGIAAFVAVAVSRAVAVGAVAAIAVVMAVCLRAWASQESVSTKLRWGNGCSALP